MKDKITFTVHYWVFLIVISFLILGMSYALFSETIVGNRRYHVHSDGLRFYLNEEGDENIVLDHVVPVSDEEGLKNPLYQFSLVNEENQDLAYTIYLKEESSDNPTPFSAIRYHYTQDENGIDVIRGLGEQVTEDGSAVLETGVIPAHNTYHYHFQMWIDSRAGNEIVGTECSVYLEVEASQTLDFYTDSVLNGCDPVLIDRLVPVTISEDGTVRKASLYKEWYNYQKQEWANAVVLENDQEQYDAGEIIPIDCIESYFVWIPRYKYRIFSSLDDAKLGVFSDSAVKSIEIVFESKEVDVSNGDVVGSWHSHPAFQAFDSNGFWVGKFESGYKGAATRVEAEVNSSNPDKLMIRPNVFSWRNIALGNAFKVSYDYLRGAESHMMKNTEWGAIAYLQHSIFGSESSVRMNNYSDYKTGYAAIAEPTLGYHNAISIAGNLVGVDEGVTLPYNTAVGYTASTTGNITGVYDMAGGAHEYVMGYNIQASRAGGESGITGIYGDFFTNDRFEKYYDQYQNPTDSNTSYQNRILGDATGEMGPFADETNPLNLVQHVSSWYHDSSYFLISSAPWFDRGAVFYGGVEGGIFSFSSFSGVASPDLTFRVVLTP